MWRVRLLPPSLPTSLYTTSTRWTSTQRPSRRSSPSTPKRPKVTRRTELRFSSAPKDRKRKDINTKQINSPTSWTEMSFVVPPPPAVDPLKVLNQLFQDPDAPRVTYTYRSPVGTRRTRNHSRSEESRQTPSTSTAEAVSIKPPSPPRAARPPAAHSPSPSTPPVPIPSSSLPSQPSAPSPVIEATEAIEATESSETTEAAALFTPSPLLSPPSLSSSVAPRHRSPKSRKDDSPDVNALLKRLSLLLRDNGGTKAATVPALPISALPLVRESFRYPPLSSPPVLASALRPIVHKKGPVFLHEVTNDPYYKTILHPDTLNMHQTGDSNFVSPSHDDHLLAVAADQGCVVAASTSSTTGVISHLYYVMLGHTDIDFQPSRSFSKSHMNFTLLTTAPVTIIMKKRTINREGQVVTRRKRIAELIVADVTDAEVMNGEEEDEDATGDRTVWGIDKFAGNDAPPAILRMLGHSMEKMLTTEPEEFQRTMMKPLEVNGESASSTSSPLSPSTHTDHHCFSYMRANSLLLRSQLDCHDPSLHPAPTTVFDLKSRAVYPIRYHAHEMEQHLDYKITQLQGNECSFEREYYDMARSAFLKYMLQCRIGEMRGVLVAYHNTQEIFGFQMISRREMEKVVCGHKNGPIISEILFQRSLKLLDLLYQTIIHKVETLTTTTTTTTTPSLSSPLSRDSIKVMFASSPLDPHRLSIYVEVLPSPASDFDGHLPFSHRHSTASRLDELETEDLLSIAAAHHVDVDVEGSAPISRRALLSKLEHQLTTTTSRDLAPLSHYVSAIEQGDLFKLNLVVSHRYADGEMMRGSWQEEEKSVVEGIETYYELEQAVVGSVDAATRLAKEYRSALIAARLHQVSGEEEGEDDEGDEGVSVGGEVGGVEKGSTISYVQRLRHLTREMKTSRHPAASPGPSVLSVFGSWLQTPHKQAAEEGKKKPRRRMVQQQP